MVVVIKVVCTPPVVIKIICTPLGLLPTTPATIRNPLHSADLLLGTFVAEGLMSGTLVTEGLTSGTLVPQGLISGTLVPLFLRSTVLHCPSLHPVHKCTSYVDSAQIQLLRNTCSN